MVLGQKQNQWGGAWPERSYGDAQPHKVPDQLRGGSPQPSGKVTLSKPLVKTCPILPLSFPFVIEMKFTEHKSNHFKRRGPVALGNFTLCHGLLSPVLKQLGPQKDVPAGSPRSSHPQPQQLSPFLPPPAPATTRLLCVSLASPTLHNPCKWWHTTRGPLCLASFT